jgi:Family of unknown function (DUF6069)
MCCNRMLKNQPFSRMKTRRAVTIPSGQAPAIKEGSTAKLWWVIPVASILAISANVIFYYLIKIILGEPLLFPEQFPPPETSPMPVTDVILFSLIFSLGAGIVFAMIASFARRPVRTFVSISTVVLLLSLALPLRIPTPPVTLLPKLTLVAMHIIGAIVVVGTLVWLGKPKGRRI